MALSVVFFHVVLGGLGFRVLVGLAVVGWVVGWLGSLNKQKGPPFSANSGGT